MWPGVKVNIHIMPETTFSTSRSPRLLVPDVNFPNQLFIINRLCFLVERVIIVREDDGKEN